MSLKQGHKAKAKLLQCAVVHRGPEANAMNVLHACIYKSVNPGLCLTSLEATCIVTSKCCCLFSLLNTKYLRILE